jgi:tetratricopeptide (TPR) repeat protein
MNVTLLLSLVGLLLASPDAQNEPARQALRSQVEAAEGLIERGDVAGALQVLQRIVTTTPDSYHARLALGRALDLDGRHADARLHLEEAVRLAPDEERVQALAALGISYAFEARPDEAARYYQRAFDAHVQADDRASAAATANALGRIYLESGNDARAEAWYRTGHETARSVPAQPAARLALGDMRWHNAMGRIEARRGNRSAAEKHAAEVKALLDKGGNENQRAFYPYLLGYIAFYARDYQRAIDELLKGDLEDVFVLGLIAQSYAQLGRPADAAEYFRKVLALPSHSINAAFARPAAQKFLKTGSVREPGRRRR